MVAALVFVLAVTGTEAGPWLEVVRERGAEGCPDAGRLRAAVEAELGRPVAGHHVRCVVGREGRGWRARIAIEGEPGAAAARTIRADGADCRPLASALELTLALALALAPGPPPPASVPQVVDGELPDGLVARPILGAGRPWSLSAAAVVSAGALLDVSTGLELGGRWQRGRLMLALEGRGERAVPGRVGAATVGGWRASAALLSCLARGSTRLCGLARGGGFIARSEGLALSRAGQGALAEAGVRAAWQVGRGALAGAVYLEATAPLVRTRLLIDGQPGWESPALVVSLGVAAVMER